MANRNSNKEKPSPKPRSGGNRGRGRGNSKGRSNRKDEFDKEADLSTKGRDNDPNWYFADPTLAQQAAQLSFQSMVGVGTVMDDYKLPSIAVFRLNPSPGITYTCNQDRDVYSPTTAPTGGITYADDGANLMGMKLYTLLSTFSGRTAQYGPQDVTAMILAIGEVVSMVEYCRRALGIALTYNPRNRMLPLKLIDALGINSSDLIANLADYRMKLNVQIARINQIPLLDNIGYIRKCREMYQRIYVDSPSSMAQIYAYCPYTTWTLEETLIDTGTVLQTYPTRSGGASYSAFGYSSFLTYLNCISEQITKLLTSATLNMVYADMFKLASKISVPMFQLDYVKEDYIVIPEYNANALLQIHNLTIMGAPVRSGSHDLITVNANIKATPNNDVYPDVVNNCIIYNPLIAHGGSPDYTTSTYSTPTKKITLVDMQNDDPSVEDRIEALRFNGVFSNFGFKVGNDECDLFPVLNDHYVCHVELVSNGEDTRVIYKSFVPDSWTQMNNIAMLTQFSQGPLIYQSAEGSTDIDRIYGDINFYTTVDYQYVARLTRLIYTGLFEFRT